MTNKDESVLVRGLDGGKAARSTNERTTRMRETNVSWVDHKLNRSAPEDNKDHQLGPKPFSNIAFRNEFSFPKGAAAKDGKNAWSLGSNDSHGTSNEL